MSVRFTAWLSEREREAMRSVELRECVSANWVIRTALRKYLGIDDNDSELPVTSDTIDNEVQAA